MIKHSLRNKIKFKWIKKKRSNKRLKVFFINKTIEIHGLKYVLTFIIKKKFFNKTRINRIRDVN